MIEGVDYSWARPGGATLAAAGKRFAFRYIPYLGHGGKGLTIEEAADLRGNGVDVGFVFERYEARMREGYDAGVNDALVTESVFEAFGVPGGVVAYFACDYNAPASDFGLIGSYLDGAAEVLGRKRVGVYGHFDLIQWAASTGTAPWRWQTYAWSGGRVSDFAHVLQYLNGQDLNGAVDFCRAHVEEFGQWHADKAEEVPPVAADDILRDSMAKRESLRFVASGPEYAKAYKLLFTSGWVKRGTKREQIRRLASVPEVIVLETALDVLKEAGIDLGGW